MEVGLLKVDILEMAFLGFCLLDMSIVTDLDYIENIGHHFRQPSTL